MERIDEFALSNGNALDMIRLSKQFEISFEIFPEVAGNMTKSVLFVGDTDGYGNAQSIYVKENSTLCFSNGNGYGNAHEQSIPLNEWSRIMVNQLVDSEGDFTYQIFVSGNKVYEAQIQTPTEIEDATVFAAQEQNDKHNGAAEAKLRNLLIVSHDCPTGSHFDGVSCTR